MDLVNKRPDIIIIRICAHLGAKTIPVIKKESLLSPAHHIRRTMAELGANALPIVNAEQPRTNNRLLYHCLSPGHHPSKRTLGSGVFVESRSWGIR
jgi:hypothetical protein